MIFIYRDNKNPWFNIAAEEYVLKHTNKEAIMLWQSSPSVIIGKHQNTLNEVNTEFAKSKNIPVIRRISGGGTVYHDEGNLNYSIITYSSNKSTLVNFEKSTQPIIDFLSEHNVNATYEGKSNLRIEGLKFSGNSAHVYKNRVLHHGTLLFNTNINRLNEIITPSHHNITDKAVQSIRTSVTNIYEQTKAFTDIYDFKQKLTDFLIGYYKIVTTMKFSDDDISKINDLVTSKYSLWDWNYGYSPNYSFVHTHDSITLKLEVTKSIITFAEIVGNFNYKHEICTFLINKNHSEEVFRLISRKFNLSEIETTTVMKMGGF